MTIQSPLLIVPGFKGSGPDHWQTWLQQQVPEATRIDGIDWDAPILAHWAGRVRHTLARTAQPQQVVAHSFGCLAAVVAAADRPEYVADLILVAPASPERFNFTGLRAEAPHGNPDTLACALPMRALGVSGCVIASSNDAWLDFAKARLLAATWGLDFHDAGPAGHINAASGYGAWPGLLALLAQRSTHAMRSVHAEAVLKRGRGSALATVRQFTRAQLEARTGLSIGRTKT